MACIVRELATSTVTSTTRSQPLGVDLTPYGTYKVRCNGKHLGNFKSLEEAVARRTEYDLVVKNANWEAYLLIEPDRDLDNDVAIRLTGVRGTGLYSKVDLSLWHRLTFNCHWSVDTQGYARGSVGGSIALHKAVFLRLHPGYVSSQDNSIDHINLGAIVFFFYRGTTACLKHLSCCRG
jgi:hypothetical protein